jgi:WXXGXW repeat (2 copies)
MRFLGSMRKLVVAGALMVAPAASFAGIFISVGIAPPALPVYTQPLCPGDGYLWTPGYWGYGPAGYYWVPGVWVRPPQVGVLWTPGYWGWGGSAFIFHEGYWGPHIGFYGGVNYGFGYGGVGFEGGYWNHGVFAYNRSVSNINVVNVHNVYNKTVVVNNVTVNRVSYNGGTGGIGVHASASEQAAIREQHSGFTSEQQMHVQAAASDRNQLASVNGGRPQMAAARTSAEYHTVASQHAASQPITERDRAANQQQRIGNGVKSGQLTPHETANVEKRDASINHQANADRAANGGKLTPQEHQQINQRQNNVSGAINNDKHNAATDHPVQHQQAEAHPQAENKGGGGGHPHDH